MNRLQHERSPYLLQHAKNPVDWYPWGEEAFAKAKREDKLIFLSIGYSACHWCHVMEHESFTDEETAQILAKHYVSIKVDREERPDIDQIYQLAYQVLHQRGGGWPLSMFLTTDKRPFYGGTYYPPQRRYGMPSFKEVLHSIHEAYTSRPKEVKSQAQELTEVLQRVSKLSQKNTQLISPELIEQAAEQIVQRGDPVYGGTKGSPKFPNTMMLDLAVISASRGDGPALAHITRTLDNMHRGGMYDHLGGGFARYSVDEKWLIPHFEKMLYDNAQLARLYLDGWRLLRSPEHEQLSARCQEIVSAVLGYALREMTSSQGTFYSAQDADSEGEEGKFFAWTPRQIAEVVGFADAEIACAYFEVTDVGTFEHGKSVLSTPRPVAEVAKRLQKTEAEILATLERVRPKLFAARELRVKPFRDEKCLASWNGLLIGAMVEAGAALGEPAWVSAAQRALHTWRTLAWNNGHLLHAIKDGVPYGVGFLDDYGGLAVAALDVFEATGDAQALLFARQLTDAALALFWDEAAGDFYYTPSDAEVVLYRPKDPHDHAYPGGVGLMATALLRLFGFTGSARYQSCAERLVKGIAGAAQQNPMGLSTLVRAIDLAARGPVEIIIMGDRAHPETAAMIRAVSATFLPHRMLIVVKDQAESDALGLSAELVKGRTAKPDGAPRAYVCRGQLCEAPVTSGQALRAVLLRRTQ